MAKFEKAIEPSGHTGTFNLRMIGVSERASKQESKTSFAILFLSLCMDSFELDTHCLILAAAPSLHLTL